MKRSERIALLVLAHAVLGLMAYALWLDARPEWKSYQRRYRLQAGDRQALEILQVILPESVDRCPTCHAGFQNQRMKTAPLPWRYHAGLDSHPPLKFGCTCCHEGQGAAVDMDSAHGRNGRWPRPVLAKEYTRATCARCHREGEIPGAPETARGRELFREFGCRGCHKLNGVGGRIGPDLSAEGISGRTPDWHLRHFRRPGSVTAESPMPVFPISDSERHDLIFLILSFAPQPAAYAGDPLWAATEANAVELIRSRNCLACHRRGAPPLDDAGHRLSAGLIERVLISARVVNENAPMPDFAMELSARKAVARFLGQAPPDRIRAIEPATTLLDPVEDGRVKFTRAGCVGCHGRDAKGGLPNPNSQSKQVLGLHHLAEDYTKPEVLAIVRRGRIPPIFDPKKPAPPLYMPTWGAVLTTEEIARIVEYAWSLSAAKVEAW